MSMLWDTTPVKTHIHARFGEAEAGHRQSACDLAGPGVGRSKNGPRDLSTSRRHCQGFDE